MTKLKPCPFCGGEGEICGNFGSSMMYILCNGCGARSKYGYNQHTIDRWNRRAEQPNETQWIPVSERLPTVDKYGDVNVLVHLDDGFISSATYDKNNGWELWADAGEVTHWTYHPEPPKGE